MHLKQLHSEVSPSAANNCGKWKHSCLSGPVCSKQWGLALPSSDVVQILDVIPRFQMMLLDANNRSSQYECVLVHHGR